MQRTFRLEHQRPDWYLRRSILTFDEPLSHEVIVHRLCNDFGDFIAIKLNKGVTFTSTRLQV